MSTLFFTVFSCCIRKHRPHSQGEPNERTPLTAAENEVVLPEPAAASEAASAATARTHERLAGIVQSVADKMVDVTSHSPFTLQVHRGGSLTPSPSRGRTQTRTRTPSPHPSGMTASTSSTPVRGLLLPTQPRFNLRFIRGRASSIRSRGRIPGSRFGYPDVWSRRSSTSELLVESTLAGTQPSESEPHSEVPHSPAADGVVDGDGILSSSTALRVQISDHDEHPPEVDAINPEQSNLETHRHNNGTASSLKTNSKPEPQNLLQLPEAGDLIKDWDD